MLILRRRAYARAGLLGNPSDGYHGKTISFTIRDFHATAILYEWEDVEIVLGAESQVRFESIHDLVRDVRLHGYYGGLRLIKATIKRFVEYCLEQRLRLHDRNFSIRYESTIPRQVGLAGSSAIIVATLRCLMDFYEVSIPLEVQPSLALSVETKELGIAAGLQDRVVQVYEGLVWMDFSPDKVREVNGLPCGLYDRLDPSLLPPIYVAFQEDLGEPTEVFHNDVRERYQRGDPQVVQSMQELAMLAEKGRMAMLSRDHELFADLVNRNFDIRRSLYPLPPGQVEMVQRARQVGASAKFAGSGGAITGTYRDDNMLNDLKATLQQIGCVVLRPTICPATPSASDG